MPSYAQNYLSRLESYQSELLERLELLVNIDSGSGQVEGIAAIMSSIRKWMNELDFTVTTHPTEQFGENLVARRQGKGSTRILLVGHLDTVYGAGSTAKRPFSIEDGLAYGPGTIDMKSGILMGIYALRVLLESGFDDFGELCFAFNNDEEVGSAGSAPLLRELARQADVGLVLEGSRNPEIITKARKGADKYMLEVTGRPAHSGAEPHKGRSAVIELAHKLLAIHQLNTLYPGVTFNVTNLNSTRPLNIIPDFASCSISVRAFTAEGLDMAAEALEKIVAGNSVPDTHTRLIRTRGRVPYKATPEILQLVEIAQAEGSGLNLKIIAESKGGVSDANLLMEEGLPTLDSLGPVGGGMHDLQREYLRLESLPLRGALLAGIIQHICLLKSTGEEPSS